MNKRSVKGRSAKKTTKSARRTVARKAPARRASARKVSSVVARKPDKGHALKTHAIEASQAIAVGAVTVAQVTVRDAMLGTHKYRVGQTVLFTSSPITRPGASGTYKVVKLLPSDGDDYQYRIKNPGEAFERVAKESQLELEH
jgi:hypothetical protein